MPTVLPNTGMQLPVRGSAGASLWADTLDANLQIIDAMDHTPGHGPRIPSAGMNINADLPFSSLYAPTQLHRAQFSAIASAAMTNAMNKSLFVSDGTSGLSTNELYWRTTSGATVKLTSGSSLNIAGFAGGISGDFTATGAIVSYDDAAKRYLFKEGTLESNNWARIYCGGIRLAQFNTNESLYVEHLCPDALAAPYAVTWPLAVPAATHPLQMTSAGVIVETGSIAMATDENITVSGTGEFKHGTRTLQIPMLYAGSNAWNNATLASGTVIGVSLANGSRITAIRARVRDSAISPTKLTIALQSVVDGVASTIATSAQSAGTGVVQTLPVTGLTATLASGTNYQVLFTKATGADTCAGLWIEVDFDRP